MPNEKKEATPKTLVKSTKEELVMYTILLLGVTAIVSVFFINISLIDKLMENLIMENTLLRGEFEVLDKNTSSNLVELQDGEVIVTVTPAVEESLVVDGEGEMTLPETDEVETEM